MQAFYLPNKDRPNFSVFVSAHAYRVLTSRIEDGLLFAHGVEFVHEGRLHRVNARKEVILCAGYVAVLLVEQGPT